MKVWKWQPPVARRLSQWHDEAYNSMLPPACFKVPCWVTGWLKQFQESQTDSMLLIKEEKCISSHMSLCTSKHRLFQGRLAFLIITKKNVYNMNFINYVLLPPPLDLGGEHLTRNFRRQNPKIILSARMTKECGTLVFNSWGKRNQKCLYRRITCMIHNPETFLTEQYTMFI